MTSQSQWSNFSIVQGSSIQKNCMVQIVGLKLYTHVYICLCVYTDIHLCVCTYICIYMCVYTCTYMYVYVCVHLESVCVFGLVLINYIQPNFKKFKHVLSMDQVLTKSTFHNRQKIDKFFDTRCTGKTRRNFLKFCFYIVHGYQITSNIFGVISNSIDSSLV